MSVSMRGDVYCLREGSDTDGRCNVRDSGQEGCEEFKQQDFDTKHQASCAEVLI